MSIFKLKINQKKALWMCLLAVMAVLFTSGVVLTDSDLPADSPASGRATVAESDGDEYSADTLALSDSSGGQSDHQIFGFYGQRRSWHLRFYQTENQPQPVLINTVYVGNDTAGSGDGDLDVESGVHQGGLKET